MPKVRVTALLVLIVMMSACVPSVRPSSIGRVAQSAEAWGATAPDQISDARVGQVDASLDREVSAHDWLDATNALTSIAAPLASAPVVQASASTTDEVSAKAQSRPQEPNPTPLPDRAQVPAVSNPVESVGVLRSGPAAVTSMIPASAYRWLETHGWSVEWRQGPGPGRVAEAQYATSTIVIWYTSNRSNHIWAGAFAHELGHAVSFVHFSQSQMTEWNQMRGLDTWRWVPGTPTDFTVGEGDFAEAFMNYLLGHEVRSIGGPLTQPQRQWIAANTPF